MCNNEIEDKALLQRVANELESLREHEQSTSCKHHEDGKRFPRACKVYLQKLAGNTKCVDCGISNPDWASITYGTLLCVRCSGRHRSYGVTKSRVRSVSMDNWSHTQILAMLEGGNKQLQTFFQRHGMDYSTYRLGNGNDRYHTKAALFYRTHLERHVTKVYSENLYQGRIVSRAKPQPKKVEVDEEKEKTVETLPSSASCMQEEVARVVLLQQQQQHHHQSLSSMQSTNSRRNIVAVQ